MKAERVDVGPLGSGRRATSLEVLATYYNIRRIRVGQLLIPLAAIVTPLATHLMAPLGLLASVILSGGAIWSFVSARSRRAANLCVRNHVLHLGPRAIHPASTFTWSWRGDRAILFLSEGNVAVRARSQSDMGELEATIRSTLGSPLKYRRRGSFSTRVIAASTFFVGLMLTGLGFAYNSFIAPLGLLLIVFGGAAHGAFSQKIVDIPATRSQRD